MEGNMVGISVTVSLRLRVGMTLRDSVGFRLEVWPGFGHISVPIRNDGWRVLIAVVAVGVLVRVGVIIVLACS